MKTLSALDLRKKLGSILDKVAKDKEQVLVSRANKPLAVIISVDEYQEKILKGARGQKLKELSARLDAWRGKHRKKTASIDVVRVIREMRERRW